MIYVFNKQKITPESRAKNQRLAVRLIKILINPPSLELALMVGTKRKFLSVTSLNNFQAYSFDESVHFVHSYMPETLLSVNGIF